MPLQFTPYVIIAAVTLAILIWLALAIWRRRPGAAVVPMVVMLSGVILWTLANAVEVSVTKLAVKKVLAAFVYLGITMVPPGWLGFVLEYTGREHRLSRRNVLLLAVQPVLVQVAIMTNGLHHLFWIERTLDTSGPYALIDVTLGPLFWVHAAYSYVLLLVGAILLIGAFIRSPQVYRGQMFWMLVAAFAPWGSNFLYLSGLSPLPDYIDPTPLAFTVTVLAISWSVFRHHLTDMVPVARDIVVESISDAVIVLDRNNRIVDANPAALKMIDLPFKAVAGQLLESYLTDQPDLVEKYRGVEQVQAEIELNLAEGPPHTYNMNLSPLRNRRGDLVGRVIVLHDITDLKEANRELKIAREKAEESNRLKSQFLTTISHELRTPLHAIHGFTELTLEGITGEINDLQRKNLERVLANADNLNRMIDDLLDLSKIEAGRVEVAKQPFDVKAWFHELVEQTKKLANEKGLLFVTILEGDMPDQIIGDPDRLRQIAAKLISNAVKFTEKGEVKVTIKREGDDLWQISVSDTGIGIPPQAQEYIFDRFRQADGGPTRQYGGTGLGLAIVRDLAMMMGGGVRVKSELGKGSTFTVTLPLPVAKTADTQSAGG